MSRESVTTMLVLSRNSHQVRVNPLQKSFELIERQWSAEEITLIGMATVLREKVSLGFFFDAFSDNRQTQTLRQNNDHLRNLAIIRVSQDVSDKTLVNF